MVSDVRDRTLDPRLVTTNQCDHARPVDGPEGMALTAMQHDSYFWARRDNFLVPVEEEIDDSQRVSGNRHVEVGIVDSQAMRGANHQHLCVTNSIDGDACRLSQR